MKRTWREKIRYAFDNLMGKGTAALIGMLFLITAIVVIIAGILCNITSEGATGYHIWVSLMHALDAGTLAGDDTSQMGTIVLMTVVTICGIFVTSILIGIISSGFEEKLNSLRKGFSKVIEDNHTVIIGFNDGIYTILTELIEANASEKKACILVIGEEEKEIMDEMIRNHIGDMKTTRIICRSGKFTNKALLEMASIETARSIIINEEDDFQVIKAILSTVSFLKSKNCFENSAHITTLIHEEQNYDAAVIAGEGKAEVIYFKDMIARVVANTCRQPGLSAVLTGMFGFDGDEFYFEEFPELTGKVFGDVLNLFRKSIVVGIYREGHPMLNPPMDMMIQAGDRIIHLEEDNGVSRPESGAQTRPAEQLLAQDMHTEREDDEAILILGHNDSLPIILRELGDFARGTLHVTVACDSMPEDAREAWGFEGIDLELVETNIYDKEILEELLNDSIHNLLLLSDSEEGEEAADSRILLLLLQIRYLSTKNGWDFNITSEMNSVENQKLMQVANVKDFVVGSTITSLIVSQISENRGLMELFQTLLTAEGSELYMKPAMSYVKPDVEMTFWELTDVVRRRSEIAVGYRKYVDGRDTIVINPDKSTSTSFRKGDLLIVIAEDYS